jgi:hypothetical protein
LAFALSVFAAAFADFERTERASGVAASARLQAGKAKSEHRTKAARERTMQPFNTAIPGSA